MLNGKTALITGGTSGIGLATAKLLRANGARVAVTGREADALERAREVIGGDLLTLQTDVLSRDALRKMASDVQHNFSALDIFFANAGVAYVTPLATTSEAQYDALMDTNVRSVFFSVQAVEPIMREGSSIILNTAWLNQVGGARPGYPVGVEGGGTILRPYAIGRAARPAHPRKRGQSRVDRHAHSSGRGPIRTSRSDRCPVSRLSRRR